MTAIGGSVGPLELQQLVANCSTILNGLDSYRSGAPAFQATAGASFGVGLFDLFAEHGNSGAALLSNERLLLVADIRLDNRADMAAEGAMRCPLRDSSDAEILLHAWMRRGEACLDRLTGDFALAVFDKQERSLTLARDATGQRPLFYAQSGETVAFASMPSGLLGLPELRRGWNLCRFAAMMNVIGLDDPQTYFEGIFRVLPGQAVRFSSRGPSKRQHWNPLPAKARRMSFNEAMEEYRHVLSEAVECRIRRRSGKVAVHLSSGYDSSAIAATAAMCGGPDEVLAYTAAPSLGFAGPVGSGRLGDESAIARVTADYCGITHAIVRPPALSLDYLKRQARLHQDPLRNVINGLWADEIRNQAQRDGATVLLNGMGGNMTLNAGGTPYLSEWVRQRGVLEWSRQARLAARRGDVRWRGILYNSFAPWLPPGLWSMTCQLFRRQQVAPPTFLHPQWRLSPSDVRHRAYGQPNRSTAQQRVDFMRACDPAVFHKGGLAESGVWELEPLADRRVVEFSLALSPEQLICNGEYRPVARAALRGLLPTEVLDSTLRGVQSPDWQRHFRSRETLAILDEIDSSASAGELFDLKAMRSALERCPTEDRSADPINVVTYTSALAMALTAGVFIKEMEEGWNSRRAASESRTGAPASQATAQPVRLHAKMRLT